MQVFLFTFSSSKDTVTHSLTINSKLMVSPAFLAATVQLRRHFSGRRTDEILARYPTDRTNFWPYLLYRQREEASRRRIYEESFLGHALKGRCILTKELWGSPGHERQAAVTVR